VSASSLDLKSTRLDALLLPLASRDWEAALHSMRTQWAAVAGAFDGELLVLDLRGLPPQGAPVPWLRIKQAMAKIIVVTSGKGGVGKTTTSASFASGLALRGHKTAVIDFDVGLRNLDLIMGCERRVVYDLINVIQGEANLNQALIKDKQCDNLFVLAASQTRDKDALTQDGVEKVLTTWPHGLRVHRLRLARRHRNRRADGHALCRRGAGGDQPRGLQRARLRPHPGHAGQQDQARHRGGEPIKEHLLITRYNPNRVQDGQMLSWRTSRTSCASS
jgi:septum site-determining protein MinD